jgi:hypothetical protein
MLCRMGILSISSSVSFDAVMSERRGGANVV